MKVNNRNSTVGGVDRTPPPHEPSPVAPRPDRVSVDESQKVAHMAAATQATLTNTRASRLRDIEVAVRSGAYKPDPSQVAEEILAAAEVDARLRALFHG